MFLDRSTSATDDDAECEVQPVLFSEQVSGNLRDVKSTFDPFLAQIPLRHGLRTEQMRIHSYGRGCPSLLIKVVCESWRSSPAIRDGRRYIVENPSQFFDVHMELEVKPGRDQLELLVHHETRPYLTKFKLGSRVDADVAEAYRQRRRAFDVEFGEQCHVTGFKKAAQWMLVGKIGHDYTHETTTEVCDWLRTTIEVLAVAIDRTLNVLETRELASSNGATQNLFDVHCASAETTSNNHDGDSGLESSQEEPSLRKYVLEPLASSLKDDLEVHADREEPETVVFNNDHMTSVRESAPAEKPDKWCGETPTPGERSSDTKECISMPVVDCSARDEEDLLPPAA